MGFSVPLRLVSSANSKRLEESFEAMRKQYATNADELCFTEYPKQKVLGRGRVLTTLRRLYNDYIKKADPNIKLETYEEQINRILDKAYPSPEALRASMSLQGGPFSIQLPDNMSKGAPMEQVMKSMVEGLRNSLKDRLVQAKEVFLNGKRLGDTSVQALTRDLEVFSNQNILGDAVIENAVRSALDYIQGLATDEPIKQVRTTVASVMSEIALSVDTTGGIAEVRRNLEGSRRRRLK